MPKIQTLIQQRSEGQREVASRLREALEARRKATEAIPFDEPALLTPEQQAQAVKLGEERAARQPQQLAVRSAAGG